MFIDDHREHLGVEAICKVLPIAPSTYYHKNRLSLDPEKASDRAKRDAYHNDQDQPCLLGEEREALWGG